MPYTSQKQKAFFHTPAARQAGITPDETAEYDQESAALPLPKVSPKSPRAMPDAIKHRVAIRRALQGKRTSPK